MCPILQVRAAAVYALGTFMNSVVQRSEHANNIDHSVATMLLNTVSHDMSPLVRKVSDTFVDTGSRTTNVLIASP